MLKSLYVKAAEMCRICLVIGVAMTERLTVILV